LRNEKIKGIEKANMLASLQSSGGGGLERIASLGTSDCRPIKVAHGDMERERKEEEVQRTED